MSFFTDLFKSDKPKADRQKSVGGPPLKAAPKMEYPRDYSRTIPKPPPLLNKEDEDEDEEEESESDDEAPLPKNLSQINNDDDDSYNRGIGFDSIPTSDVIFWRDAKYTREPKTKSQLATDNSKKFATKLLDARYKKMHPEEFPPPQEVPTDGGMRKSKKSSKKKNLKNDVKNGVKNGGQTARKKSSVKKSSVKKSSKKKSSVKKKTARK